MIIEMNIIVIAFCGSDIFSLLLSVYFYISILLLLLLLFWNDGILSNMIKKIHNDILTGRFPSDILLC